VIFRARSAVENDIWMIGDASGVIDPLTGNGMAMAVQSALLAAPRIIRLLESPRHRERLSEEYRRSHHAFFAPRVRWSRIVARILSRPLLLHALLNTFAAPTVGALLFTKTRASARDMERLVRQVE
jgi:flavin-dependent dehydrogenase